jgi:hypothetical protein
VDIPMEESSKKTNVKDDTSTKTTTTTNTRQEGSWPSIRLACTTAVLHYWCLACTKHITQTD